MFSQQALERLERGLPEKELEQIRVLSVLEVVRFHTSHPDGEPFRVVRAMIREKGWPLHHSIETISLYGREAPAMDICDCYEKRIVEACIEQEPVVVKKVATAAIKIENQLEFCF